MATCSGAGARAGAASASAATSVKSTSPRTLGVVFIRIPFMTRKLMEEKMIASVTNRAGGQEPDIAPCPRAANQRGMPGSRRARRHRPARFALRRHDPTPDVSRKMPDSACRCGRHFRRHHANVFELRLCLVECPGFEHEL